MEKLVLHVGMTHDNVEQFLDQSLHVPRRQVKPKSPDHECSLCQKQFSDRYNLRGASEQIYLYVRVHEYYYVWSLNIKY